MHPVQMSKKKKVVTGTRHSKKCMARNRHTHFVPLGEKVLAKPTSTDPMHRVNPRYKFGIWLSMRNNSAECFIENAHG